MNGPTERQIRDLLRDDAARVSLPADMWDKIASRLDEPDIAPTRLSAARQSLRNQWRPAMAFLAGAAAFWVLVLPPALDATESGPPVPAGTVIVTTEPAPIIEGQQRRQGLNEWSARLVSISPVDSSTRSMIVIR